MLINVQCIRNKLLELEILIGSHQPDILCVCEHWLSREEIPSLNIPGYNVVASYCRTLNKNGGVAILVKEDIVVNICDIDLSHLNTEMDFESAITNVTVGGVLIFIVTLYRSPLGDFQNFLEKLDCALDIIFKYTDNPNIILTGDFNCDWLSNSVNNTNLSNIFKSYLLFNSVTEPTRCTNHSQTLLDYVVTNLEPSSVHTKVIISDLSDHYPVLSTFSTITPANARKISSRCFSEANTLYFLNLLNGENWSDVYTAQDYNARFSAFYDKFLYYFDVAFPVTTR